MTTTHLLSGSLAQAIAALGGRRRFMHRAGRMDATAHLDVAVAHAFGRFTACYGAWSESLFDRHFLQHHAARTLAAFAAGKLSQPDAAEELAAAWDRQFGGRPTERRRQRRAELVPAACTFLSWVADGLPRPERS